MGARDLFFLYPLSEFSNKRTSLSLRWKQLCLTPLYRLTWTSPSSPSTTVVINVLSEPVSYSHSYKSFLLLLLLLGFHAPLPYALHRCEISNRSGLSFVRRGRSERPQIVSVINQWCLRLDPRKLFLLCLLSKTQEQVTSARTPVTGPAPTEFVTPFKPPMFPRGVSLL